MIDKIKKYLLYIAFIISLIVYSFWKYIKEVYNVQIFYIGVATYITILSYQIYKDNKNSFIRFLLFELAVANLIKELFLNPGELLLQEALLIVIVPVIWYLRNGKYN